VFEQVGVGRLRITQVGLMKEKLLLAQQHIRKQKIDGWLLYDFHGSNEHARRFLEIPPDAMATRRFFYWIPAKGNPVKIVHAIESHLLEEWPGEKKIYFSWPLLTEHLHSVLKGVKRAAMEYSPDNAIPYVSRVDGGTIDMVRKAGVEVVSSGSFLPYFTAILDERQRKSHFAAAKALDQIAGDVWKWIGDCLKKRKRISEYEIQQKILEGIERKGCIAEGAPIVALNAHSADPHHSPSKKRPAFVKMGDFILLDLWCKKKAPGSIYGDITRVGIAAKQPKKEHEAIFQIVKKAQKAATELICKRFREGKEILGFEADDAARQVIQKAGYGEYFTHRTGHSIELSLHGSGAHLDNLEMHDERPLLPKTCFSVEPGIYLPGKFGVRLEYDLYVHADGRVEITGGDPAGIACLF